MKVRARADVSRITGKNAGPDTDIIGEPIPGVAPANGSRSRAWPPNSKAKAKRPMTAAFSRKIFGLCCVAFIAAFVQTACSKQQSVIPESQIPASIPSTGEAYRLGPRDKLRVVVFGEGDLSGSYEVDATGSIALPLVGAVPVAMLTVREAEARVRDAVNEFLVQPRVSIEIEENRPFYIYGEVQRGGEFPFVANMHALNAISMAGGFTPRANKDVIFLTRAGADDEVAVPATSQTKILPGDILRIGERRF